MKFHRKLGVLDPLELEEATKSLIRIVQNLEFNQEINHLKSKQMVPSNSKILSLTPFLDSEGLIRVGGRLEKSSLSFDQKHQYLLPNHHFTMILIRHEHIKNLHCGIQQTQALIRRNFWPINLKNTVKKIIHHCIPCFRAKPKRMEQLLGDLPKDRIETCRPFHTTGLDFCGPFSVRYKNQRKDTYSKVYVCIFICFTTKAIHLEVVEDATSETFIACLKRFFSRRGKSANLWSDNATNFTGAHNKLTEIKELFKRNADKISSVCAADGVKWNFIPPKTPNFGGLWESGVKILKTYMKKIVGDKIMTLEYIYTLVVEIEGIMNSRPISQLSSDPNDLEPLTPGHFLTGTAITSTMEPDVTSLPINRLSQWKQLTQMTQHFWKRFNLEYIHTLQQRKSCKLPRENLKVDELVIIVDENLPSTHWLIGRVQQVTVGTDGKVRSAVIKTKNGTYTRGITKLAKLPLD